MNRNTLFELLKDNKKIKIIIEIKGHNIALIKFHDTYYHIIVDSELRYFDTSIVYAIDDFIKTLKDEENK